MSSLHSLVKPSEALLSDSDGVAHSFFLINEEEPKEKKETFHSLVFDGIKLLIPEGTLGEVLDNVQICSLPKTSQNLLGVCSMRGAIIPVFDLHFLLDMASIKKRDRIMVVGEGANKVGFVIESLPHKVNFVIDERISRKPPLPKRLTPFVKSCFHRDGVWIEWDIFNFFKAAGKLA